jgi:hypothetical protein
MAMARFSRPLNIVTIQLRNIGTAVHIPAPPKQMNAYLSDQYVLQIMVASRSPNGIRLDGDTYDKGDCREGTGSQYVPRLLPGLVGGVSGTQRKHKSYTIYWDRHDW